MLLLPYLLLLLLLFPLLLLPLLLLREPGRWLGLLCVGRTLASGGAALWPRVCLSSCSLRERARSLCLGCRCCWRSCQLSAEVLRLLLLRVFLCDGPVSQ